MRETTIERYLCRRVKELGGKAYKLQCPGNDGMPDRLVCLPGGRVYFVETKTPGETPRPLQQARFAELRELGFPVYILDDKRAVEIFIHAREAGCRSDCPHGHCVVSKTESRAAPIGGFS